MLEPGIAAAGAANGDLLFLRAGLRESRGDLAGAIADYETLYARSSDSPVLANNLASLLTAQARERTGARMGRPSSAPTPSPGGCAAATCRSSRTPTAGSCCCAATPPRRGTISPQAAAALPGNAQVQFHLGEAERALGNRDAAGAAYAAALAAAEAGSPLPQAAAVRARVAEPAAPAEGAAAGGPSGG